MGREARANEIAAAEIAPFLLSLPIAKRDDEKRLVTGVATAEILDKQGEIVDYVTAKKFFTDETRWPGNIREMHAPKAVGKAVEVECDDANKTISITARISKGAPDTWEKILDGTLSMFSIGGGGKRVIEKSGDKVLGKRVFLEQLAEVSLVDNGANPAAKFAIVKSVEGKLELGDGVGGDPDESVTKATAALDAALEVAKADGKKDDKNKTASGQEGKWYAGTDGESFPISTAKDVSNAARALGRTNQDKAKVKANIIRIAYAHDLVSGLPDAWKKKEDQKDAEKSVRAVEIVLVEGKTLEESIVKALSIIGASDTAKGGPEPYDIDSALAAISFVNRLMSNEYWEARYASAGASDGQKTQIAMLKSACDALLAFLQAEYEEQFEPSGDTGALPALDLSDVLGDDDVVEMFVKSLAVIQKAGARHSKKDQEMVQKVHDTSTALGADCPMPDDGDTQKILAFVAQEKVGQVLKDAGYLPPASATLTVAEPTEAVQKITAITAELETTKAALKEHQATVAKSAETVAALEARLKTLEDQPAGGGPVRNAQVVNKGLGGPDATGDTSSPEAVVKALQELATSSDDQVVKAAAAKEILKLQTRTGSNHLAFRPR